MNIQADIIEIRRSQTAAIPHVSELRELLLYIGDADPHACAIGLIAAQIMRPTEVCYLHWRIDDERTRSFWVDYEKNRITQMQHPSYKAKGQINASNQLKVTYTMLKKPMFSAWLSEQLLKYRAKYGDCQHQHLFPWRSGATFGRYFSRLRRNAAKELPFLLEPTNDYVKGEDKTLYRISPYSFRRFSFTFHYWVTFNRDIVALSLFAGHTDVKTTWEYVYPKESIGLTQEMIDQKITWDQFVFGIDLRQVKLTRWQKDQQALHAQLPVYQGQRRVTDFLCPEGYEPDNPLRSGRIEK